MIMADLKTNYVDDVLDTTKNQLRKYRPIQNDDGTVSFVDVTEYKQVGTSFGAKDINDTNAAINDVNGKLDNKIDSNRFIMSDTGSISGFVKNNEVWFTIFNRISTPDSCACIVSRYADVVSVYTVSKSENMNIEYNDQGTITVKYNGSTNGVYGGAFKMFG